MRRALTLFALLIAGPLLSSCQPASQPEQTTTPAATLAARTLDTKLTGIYGLFVGVDKYQYSRTNRPAAEFADLEGAVGDAIRMKSAMRELYGVEFDQAGTGDCVGTNDLSVTLLNSCATRARILAALEKKIASLGPGDTLLFYFAGHGSQYRDDGKYEQDSGYHGTILPYDARNPQDQSGEIFDTELKQLKDLATAKGIYFVSIFDSCNSATATRDGAVGVSRSVPPLAGTAPPPAQSIVQTAIAGNNAVEPGYWVHLAAAQDGSEAWETPGSTPGQRAGAFTSALIETLREANLRYATFGDIINEVQLRVSRNGNVSQWPSAEGQLMASWGSRSRSTILLEASSKRGEVTLLAGSLSGMTSGSSFDFYATQDDAIKRQGRLATGTISEVSPTEAKIRLDPEPGGKLPARMYAEETAHFLAPDTLSVVNRLPAGNARQRIGEVVEAMPFATLAPRGAIHIVAIEGDPAQARLQAEEGTPIADLGAIDAPDFSDRLQAELKKIARVNQLLALRTSFRTRAGEEDSGPIEFCIAADGYRARNCPELGRGGIRQIELGERTRATVINRGAKAQYIYLLAIDPMNSVVQILPRPGENDVKYEPGRPHSRGPISFAMRGTYRFIAIASEDPIRVDAFQQTGSGVRDVAACITPLERLLCSASQGQRAANVDAVESWAAVVSPAIVE